MTVLLKLISKVFFFLSIFLLIAVTPSAAGNKKIKIPDTASKSLDYLFSISDDKCPASVDIKSIESLVDFVIVSKKENTLYRADNKFSAKSAYHEFNILTDLNKILQYAYHPDIPSYLMRPSSVRLTRWLKIDGSNKKLPRIWEHLPQLDQPVVIRGIQYVENTPDMNTGGYHNYHQYRTLILFRHKGRNVFITLSRQKDISKAARMGCAIGPDEDWHYLYSKQKGLSKRGLGWVSSYMYNSFTVSVFYEPVAGKPLVKCGIIKWLNAGWSKINVVKSKHIRNGLRRYADGLKEVVESPDLPEADELAQILAECSALSDASMKEKMKAHLIFLNKRYNKSSKFYRKKFAKILKTDSYCDQMTEQEMQAALKLETIKCIIKKKNRNPDFCKEDEDSALSYKLQGP